MERGASARADRRVVTVLFADLSGFTALGERLDPEELTDLLRDCLAELTGEIHAREGWLEKQIGDALLAVFGAPVAHEDDPVRAVRAALAMREHLERGARMFAEMRVDSAALWPGAGQDATRIPPAP